MSFLAVENNIKVEEAITPMDIAARFDVSSPAEQKELEQKKIKLKNKFIQRHKDYILDNLSPESFNIVAIMDCLSDEEKQYICNHGKDRIIHNYMSAVTLLAAIFPEEWDSIIDNRSSQQSGSNILDNH